MALLGIIRRWYIRDRISIREIARRLDISRNTVRRYIRSDVSEPAYPARRSPSSLDEFTARLSAWLSAEAIKSRKQRRTLKQMFLDLRELGYEGSYDRVAAFSRQWKVGQMERVKSASKSTKWGNILMNWAILQAQCSNLSKIEFWSDSRFHRAHRYFERFGFRHDGRVREMDDGNMPYSEKYFSVDVEKLTLVEPYFPSFIK
ncbi:winged helix-turn-helix transcriptional regulator [Herbaspirillum sp. NPDC087042]|uniref:winged helix-turn-helix transcriptional regulator n=1 Tax=Herbaspirillum sp. NPDC087042 TaxID=3364004 RepID=UPI0038246DED